MTRLQKQAPPNAITGKRPVYWASFGKAVATPVMDCSKLRAGNVVTGPAIIETTETTIVVHPEQVLRVDGWGNFELNF